MKHCTTLSMAHVLFCSLGSAVFALLMRSSLLANVVLFYRGLVFLLLIAVLLGIVVYAVKRFYMPNILVFRDVLLAVTLFYCLNLAFFIVVPVTLDRSISVYMLQSVLQADQYLTKEQIEQRFVNEYVLKNGAIDKRLHEQMVSGNLQVQGDRFKLSERGIRTTHLFDIFAYIYLPSQTSEVTTKKQPSLKASILEEN